MVDADSLLGRRVRLPSGTQSFTVRSWDDSLVLVNSYLPNSPLLTLLGPDGRVAATLDSVPFGLTSREQDSERRGLYARPMKGGEILIMPMQFVMSAARWNPATGEVHTVPISPSWFSPWSAEKRDDQRKEPGREPPLTRLQDIHVDMEGRVWLMGRVPARDFVAVEEDGVATDRLWDKWSDTIIEVYDLHTGTRLGAARSDALLTGFVGDSLVYRRSSDVDGVVSIQFFRLSTSDRFVR